MNVRARTTGRWKRWVPPALGLAAGMGVIGGIAIQPAFSQRVPIAREVKQQPERQHRGATSGLTCAGGADYPADVQLVPDAVVTTAGREAVEYHAEINVHRGNAVGLAWQAEVVDDRGQIIASGLAKSTGKSKAGASASTAAIVAQLPDGYYQVRVRVAVSPDSEPSTVMEAVQPVKVDGGKWREMEAAQWRSESNASLAVAVTGPSAKGVRQ